MPATTAWACWRSTSEPAEESSTELMRRPLKKAVTKAVTAILVNILKIFDFPRTKSPIMAQKVKAGKRKMIAEFESIVNPLSMFMVEREKVSRMPRIPIASTAEASTSGVGFKFIKTRLIDEFANLHQESNCQEKT
jgi:hypothetical protein